ncbi:MAG: VWA domain-containing protein [Janthinobacterium lividum]
MAFGLVSSTAAAQLTVTAVPQIRVEAKLVQANCTATRGKLDEPTTLNTTETEVLEDGHRQSLVAVRRGDDLPLTLTLLLDLSGSTEQRWQVLRSQSANFIRSAMRPGDRVAVLSFSDTIRVLADSDHEPSPRRLAELVEHMPVEEGMEVYKRPTGVHGTRMWDALRLATSATPMEGRKAILVLTDGVDSASAVKPEEIVKGAQMVSVPVYAVLTPSPAWTDPPRLQRPGEGPHKLREAVEQTGGITFLGDDQSVSSRLDEFVQILRSQFIVEYTPAAKSIKPKAHRLLVRSSDPHVTVHCMGEVIH